MSWDYLQSIYAEQLDEPNAEFFCSNNCERAAETGIDLCNAHIGIDDLSMNIEQKSLEIITSTIQYLMIMLLLQCDQKS